VHSVHTDTLACGVPTLFVVYWSFRIVHAAKAGG
jgi:hypothetical protein